MASMLKLLQPGSTCDDLLSCMFELNRAEANLYLILVKEGALKLDELAEKAHRERSTIYRCLSKLVSLGLVDKTAENLPGGGYFHVYKALDPDHLEKVVRTRMDEFNAHMEVLLMDFSGQIAKTAQAMA